MDKHDLLERHKLVIAEAVSSNIVIPNNNYKSCCIPFYWQDSHIISNFWKNIQMGNIDCDVPGGNFIPDGTVFCDDLTILKILK